MARASAPASARSHDKRTVKPEGTGVFTMPLPYPTLCKSERRCRGAVARLRERWPSEMTLASSRHERKRPRTREAPLFGPPEPPQPTLDVILPVRLLGRLAPVPPPTGFALKEIPFVGAKHGSARRLRIGVERLVRGHDDELRGAGSPVQKLADHRVRVHAGRGDPQGDGAEVLGRHFRSQGMPVKHNCCLYVTGSAKGGDPPDDLAAAVIPSGRAAPGAKQIVSVDQVRQRAHPPRCRSRPLIVVIY